MDNKNIIVDTIVNDLFKDATLSNNTIKLIGSLEFYDFKYILKKFTRKISDIEELPTSEEYELSFSWSDNTLYEYDYYIFTILYWVDDDGVLNANISFGTDNPTYFIVDGKPKLYNSRFYHINYIFKRNRWKITDYSDKDKIVNFIREFKDELELFTN